MSIKAILLKPLDGREIGETAEFSRADFERLKRQQAVRKAPEPKGKQVSPPENKGAKK